MTGNALYVVPSSVTASGRATFPPGGRLGRRGQAPALRVCVARRGRWSLPLLSRFARHFPLTGGIGPIGPRAATRGRPYENFGPLSSVGADLRVRPPVLGAHIGAPLHGGGGNPLPPLAFGHLPLIGGVVPRPTWCVFRRARRPGGPRRAQWSRPTKIPVHDSSLRGGPQARRGNPYSPGKKTDSHGPSGASE